MGLGGISIPSLLIILAIVILLFGTKKLKNIGGDLGGAIKGFKKAVVEDEKEKKTESVEDKSTTAEAEADVNAAQKDKVETK